MTTGGDRCRPPAPPGIAADRVTGCVLGLALGDASGAPFEGGPLERLLWRCLGRTRDGSARWTNDTQMALDVAESLIARGRVDQDDLARRFAASYRWSRGYGPGAAKVLRRIARGADWRVANRAAHADGSHGNGGAMRAPIVGVWFAGDPGLDAAARASAEVTHAHPLGQDGAAVIAAATASAVLGATPRDVLAAAAAAARTGTFREQVALVQGWHAAGECLPAGAVRAALGNGMAAARSCATALHAAVRFAEAPFVDLLRFVIELRGDVDTIAAMAGGIWGAANGAARLPAERLARLEQRERLAAVAGALHAARSAHLVRTAAGSGQ